MAHRGPDYVTYIREANGRCDRRHHIATHAQMLADFHVTVRVMVLICTASECGSNVLMEVASATDLARFSPVVSVCLLLLRETSI